MPKIKDIVKFVTLFYGIWVATRKIQKAGGGLREVVVTRTGSPASENLTELYWSQRLFSNKVDRGQS